MRRHGLIGRLTPAVVALLILVSLPAAVPALKVPLDGRPVWPAFPQAGPVVTLPAPPTEYDEDVTEALWIARALETGQPVTGGATGWVPPEIVDFRVQLEDCEDGEMDPVRLLASWKDMGIVSAEIALRPGDERRTDFWREDPSGRRGGAERTLAPSRLRDVPAALTGQSQLRIVSTGQFARLTTRCGHRAKDDVLQACAAVRGHEDGVDLLLVRELDDLLAGWPSLTSSWGSIPSAKRKRATSARLRAGLLGHLLLVGHGVEGRSLRPRSGDWADAGWVCGRRGR